MQPRLNFYDIEQNTDTWLNMRAGLLTSSNMGKVMANYGKSFGDGAKKLAVEIALQQITGKPLESGFSNAHTERGHEQEPLARMAYEEETFCVVENGGFFCDEFIGCSPDGLVLDCGLIEIKSVIAPVHYANVTRQSIDPTYKWQCYANLKYTGREWLDFISFCPSYPQDKQIYVCRIYAEKLSDEFQMIDERVPKFLDFVSETRRNIEQLNYTVH